MIINNQEYITIDEFSASCGVAKKTIEKKYKSIPIIRKIDDEYFVLKGTNYPFQIRNNKIKDKYDKKIVILKAISQNKYLDSTILKLSDDKFILYLNELINAEYIYYQNDWPNKYGTNAFELTPKGEKFLEKIKNKKKEQRDKLFVDITTGVASVYFEAYAKYNIK